MELKPLEDHAEELASRFTKWLCDVSAPLIKYSVKTLIIYSTLAYRGIRKLAKIFNVKMNGFKKRLEKRFKHG